MQDPIQRHPTRAEQLDILVSVLADIVPQGGSVLDLGCGTGFVDWMLCWWFCRCCCPTLYLL